MISSNAFGDTMSKKRPIEFYSEIDGIADKEAFIESIQEGFKD